MRALQVGHRIRARRRELALRQVDVAGTVGISPSYLNMIEHDRRGVAGGLLLRLARALELDPAALSGTEEVRLSAQVSELAADPALAGTGFDSDAAAALVGQAPDAARAMLALYRALREARAAETALRDSLGDDPLLAEASHQILTLITSIRAFSEILDEHDDLAAPERRRYLATMADESRRLSDSTRELFAVASGRAVRGRHPSAALEAEDYVQDRQNHFPALEDEADDLRRRHFADTPPPAAALDAWLVRTGGTLALPDDLPLSSRRFRLARAVAGRAAAAPIEAVLAEHRFSNDAARELARGVLQSYMAGALLLPYAPFLAAAQALRYDIERLQLRFAASFEQVCHRLTTLRRPGAAGIPFHFLRRDAAGNLSKRFSASGLPLPHYGAACTRWAVHAAFLTPGQLAVQAARLPDDSRYLFVAGITGAPAGYGRPRAPQAVLLGCAWEYAGATVYAEGAAEVPVGITCNLCPRHDCTERAAPWLAAAAR